MKKKQMDNIISVVLQDGNLIVTSIKKGEITSGTGELPVDYELIKTYTSENNIIVLKSTTLLPL